MAAWLGVALPAYMAFCQSYADAVCDVFVGPANLPSPDLGSLAATGSGHLTIDLLSGVTSLDGTLAGTWPIGEQPMVWLTQQADQDGVPVYEISSATLEVSFRTVEETNRRGRTLDITTFECVSELHAGNSVYSRRKVRRQRCHP